MERAGAVGRSQPTVRCRDREPLWLGAGVGLEGQVVEPELLIDREVRKALEAVAFGGRDRAAIGVLEVVVLLGAEALDRHGVVERLRSMLVMFVMRVVVVFVWFVVFVMFVSVSLVVGRHDRDRTPSGPPERFQDA
jgi:hypothetical protein